MTKMNKPQKQHSQPIIAVNYNQPTVIDLTVDDALESSIDLGLNPVPDSIILGNISSHPISHYSASSKTIKSDSSISFKSNTFNLIIVSSSIPR